MKRSLALSLALVALPVAAQAQSVEQQIARAVMAAPAAMRADATVIAFTAPGVSRVLRQGSNGLLCWDSSDEPGQQGRFSAQCTSERNRARVEQNHAFNNSGKSAEEIRAMFEQAERDGTRKVAEFGTLYYHIIGDDPQTGTLHVTVAVPYATAESLKMPGQRRGDGLWLMDPGTSGAHLMIPGM